MARGHRVAERNDAPRPRFDRKDGAPSRGPRNDRGPREDKKPFETQRSFGPKPGNRPARETAFDPDSPFAALAVLRDRKPE